LSIETQSRSRRSHIPPPGAVVAGPLIAASSASASREKSGSSPFSTIALRAICSVGPVVAAVLRHHAAQCMRGRPRRAH
jgi:hypothetical protein